MSIDIQSAANLTSSVVNQAIIRPLGNPNLIGISGLVLDIIDDEEIMIDSDITDHYVEQNYAIQDHIALKPIRFSLHGYAAELVNVPTPNVLNSIFTAIAGLVTLAGLAPQFNTQDSQFYGSLNNVAQLESNVVGQTLTAFALFGFKSTLVTRQQTVYQFLYNMWQTRQLCTVETPFAIFENMAIESIRALQSGASNAISDFTVTLKQILTVNSITATNNANSTVTQNTGSSSNASPVFGGAAAPLSAPPVNLGVDSGIGVDASGNTFSVASVSQSTYIQQLQLPNTY